MWQHWTNQQVCNKDKKEGSGHCVYVAKKLASIIDISGDIYLYKEQ